MCVLIKADQYLLTISSNDSNYIAQTSILNERKKAYPRSIMHECVKI